jgi:cation diffusion facilitator CzcD-associated flavoprotein CzcO
MVRVNAGSDAGGPDFDAIVVGAGFGGLRMVHEFRRLGLSVRVFEAGTDVGGAWYWNRYPGARTDSESWIYSYYFSEELLAEWDWSQRFPSQDEALRYLQYVADRFDLRTDITFSVRVTAATYDEVANVWTVTTGDGDSFTCTYFVSAAGLLTVPYLPGFPGIESFTGQWYFTGRWPKEGVDFAGKKVAVIGAGATAVQIIPIVASLAAQLHVFQRTPNYVMPARNSPLSSEQRAAIKRDYAQIWARTKQQFFGMDINLAGRVMSQTSPAEIARVLEWGWEIGGFRYIFETFDDILVDDTSNEIAAEFVRNKIRNIVHDRAVAELLCPKDHPLGGKRPPLGHFYYETFNRPNVTLVDVSGDNPITEITPTGIGTRNGHYDADIIVFATGFDALTGSVLQMDIHGRDSVSLRDKWRNGARTHLGICVDGFPNFFMLSGPQSSFSNSPVVIESAAEWIGAAVTYLHRHGYAAIDPKPEAVQRWRQRVQDLVDVTVVRQGKNSWLLGQNIPGKPQEILLYTGGLGPYRQDCQTTIDNNFADFDLRKQPDPAIV